MHPPSASPSTCLASRGRWRPQLLRPHHLSKGILRKKHTSSGTNPPGVSLNRLELKKHMRYFFCAKIFCVLHTKKLGKICSSSGREWPTIHEPNNLQMAPHRYRGRTTHRGTQNRRRVRVGFDFEPPRVAKLAIFTFCVDAGVFRIVAVDRTLSGSGSCQRGRDRGIHRPRSSRP